MQKLATLLHFPVSGNSISRIWLCGYMYLVAIALSLCCIHQPRHQSHQSKLIPTPHSHTHPQMHTHIPSTRAFTPHTPNALPKFTRFALSSRVAGATNSLVVIIAYSVQAVVVVALQRCWDAFATANNWPPIGYHPLLC